MCYTTDASALRNPVRSVRSHRSKIIINVAMPVAKARAQRRPTADVSPPRRPVAPAPQVDAEAVCKKRLADQNRQEMERHNKRWTHIKGRIAALHDGAKARRDGAPSSLTPPYRAELLMLAELPKQPQSKQTASQLADRERRAREEHDSRWATIKANIAKLHGGTHVR